MKKAPPSLGYQEVDYQVLEILRKSHVAFVAASKREAQLKHSKDGSPVMIQKLFQVRNEAIQNGVISVVMATSYLEVAIHHYGTHYIHFKTFEEHLGSLSLVSKWMIVPMLCQGIEIPEDSRQMNDLRELVKARNCIVHSKIRWMTPENPFPLLDEKEIRRFRIAAKKAVRTVDGLIDILKSHQHKRRQQPAAGSLRS